MSPTVATFLFEVGNFLVLAGVLGWLFFKPVRKSLSDHRDKLEALGRAADEKMQSAEASLAEAEAQRQAFRGELAKLRSETLQAAREEAASIVAQAREQAEQMKESAEQHLTHLEQAQAVALSHAVATAAGKLVGELLVRLNGTELHRGLLQAACDELRGLSLDSTPVTVESSQPLSEEDRARLDTALGSAASGATYRVVSELGGGVRVTTSRGLVDASIVGLADFAQRELAAELSDHPPSGAVHGT